MRPSCRFDGGNGPRTIIAHHGDIVLFLKLFRMKLSEWKVHDGVQSVGCVALFYFCQEVSLVVCHKDMVKIWSMVEESIAS